MQIDAIQKEKLKMRDIMIEFILFINISKQLNSLQVAISRWDIFFFLLT